MRTSVVIVTYRPGAWLAAAIASAVGQADEVVLVDNGTDGRVVDDATSGTPVRVVRSSRNLGFAGGANLGLQSASGDVLALLNDDAIAGDGWLASAVARLADPAVAAVTPKLLLARRFAEVRFDDDPYDAPDDARRLGRMLHRVEVAGRDVLADLLGGVHRVESGLLGGEPRTWRWTMGRDAVFVPLESDDEASSIVIDGVPAGAVRIVDLVNSAGVYLSQEGHAGDRGWEAPDDGQFDEARETFAACGAAMVLTRATLARVGGFADRFFAYYEDVDWCWRARLAGLSVAYDPAASVRHVRSASSGGEADRRVRSLSSRNRMHTLARNAPLAVVTRQLRRLPAEGTPRHDVVSAAARAAEGLAERAVLRRRRTRSPADVWTAWAGRDERWEDPGAAGPRVALPPRIRFGD